MSTNAESLPVVQEAADPASGAPNRRRSRLIAAVVVVPIVLVVALFGLGLNRQQNRQPISGPAPDFTLTSFDGQQIRLSDLRGKVVLVNFWASWCIPCHQEAPELEAAWQQYKDMGVVFVGVAWSDFERDAKAFITKYSNTYPNGLDLRTKISDLYGITGVPETFIIDRQGDVRHFVPQALDRKQIAEFIEPLLAQ
jgi:cytochrome c biogenesis protein CcmG/thiol:disulfide interchange protein DsbE